MAFGFIFVGNATSIFIEGIRIEIQQVFGQWSTIIQILVELDALVMPNLAAGSNEQIVYLNYVFFIIEDRFTIQAIHIAIQTNKIEEFKAENIELFRTLAGKQAQLNVGGVVISQKPIILCQTQKDLSVFKDERSNILVR
ncbi:hypothetical protein OCU04_004936 [Sclerotinia nivalis]|uniref:Uncharacterized protein n=1 Tax=Sclerotinia nivalis TaxID=352851 RepID=A0A9X0ASD9_9HELO|nr:hypothetical protein OCU04_004936 [Sclerotinia nivalis]